MNIGDRVKRLRIEKGMTQEQLADKLGYKSKSSVTHIENGRDIPRSLVVRLADILGTSPAYLMGWEEQTPDESIPEHITTSPVPEGTEDEWLEKLLKLNEDELLELRNYIRYLWYKRDHAADLG